jgi:hypothetical protein
MTLLLRNTTLKDFTKAGLYNDLYSSIARKRKIPPENFYINIESISDQLGFPTHVVFVVDGQEYVCLIIPLSKDDEKSHFYKKRYDIQLSEELTDKMRSTKSRPYDQEFLSTVEKSLQDLKEEKRLREE